MGKQAERGRREDQLASLEQRMTYNAMVMELSGQPPRPRDPNHKIRNDCTPRLEELAQPKEQYGPKHVTELIDFKGMNHVDNRRALEARFPGTGHDLSVQFCEAVEKHSKAAFPPTRGPSTPTFAGKRATIITPGCQLKKGAPPVSATRLNEVASRQNDTLTMLGASEQFESKRAPPAPDQRKSVAVQPMVNDISHMESLTSNSFDRRMSSLTSVIVTQADVAPPMHKTYYEVIVPTVEGTMERPNWKPRRAMLAQSYGPGGSDEAAKIARRSSRADEVWPPPWSRPVQVFIGAARSLPKADRSGHSDPYAMCQVLGKAKSRVKTHVVSDTESPVFNEAFVVDGWNEGESLEFTIFDHDLIGAHDMIATILLPAREFFQNGFEGTISLQNKWVPDEKTSADLKEFNLAQRPELEVRVFVPPLEEGAERPPTGAEEPHLSMPGAEPSTRNVCRELDAFESTKRPVERLGNFWMSQPGKTAR